MKMWSSEAKGLILNSGAGRSNTASARSTLRLDLKPILRERGVVDAFRIVRPIVRSMYYLPTARRKTLDAQIANRPLSTIHEERILFEPTRDMWQRSTPPPPSPLP